MMKKYAMLLMNPQFDSKRVQFDVEGIEHHMITVSSETEAINLVQQLVDEGFGAIEVCGAFGEVSAKRLYKATNERVPVGYVIYPDEQLESIMAFWENKT